MSADDTLAALLERALRAHEVLLRRVEELETWKAEMAEEVVTKKVVTRDVLADYSVVIGKHKTGASLHLLAQQDEGYCGILAYHSRSDDVAFDLTGADPNHECAGAMAPRRAYGSLTTYSGDGRHVQIGDDIQINPDGAQRIRLDVAGEARIELATSTREDGFIPANEGLVMTLGVGQNASYGGSGQVTMYRDGNPALYLSEDELSFDEPNDGDMKRQAVLTDPVRFTSSAWPQEGRR